MTLEECGTLSSAPQAPLFKCVPWSPGVRVKDSDVFIPPRQILLRQKSMRLGAQTVWLCDLDRGH